MGASARHRARQARRRLGAGAHQHAGLQDGPGRARDDVRRARPQDRTPGRRSAQGRVLPRSRTAMDDPVLPRPRNAPPGRAQRPARRSDRRLQGQGQPHLPGEGQPRPSGRALPRRPLAGGPARPRLLVRADRQTRQEAQADGRELRHHHAYPSYAPASPGSRRSPARSPRSMGASAPTGPGGSPTPPAGNAHRATALTTPPAQAAPACSGASPPRSHTYRPGARGRISRAPGRSNKEDPG